jgi:hypothetical protein
VEVKIWRRRVADGRDGTIIEIEREKGLLPLLLYERERPNCQHSRAGGR